MNISFPDIRVTDIGEFINYHSCERRFKLGLNKGKLHRENIPFAQRLFNPLDITLQIMATEREDEWENYLKKRGLKDLSSGFINSQNSKGMPWSEFVYQLKELNKDEWAYCREVELSGHVGEFSISGRVDFIIVLWDQGIPKLRLVECKSSRRDRSYHRIQVATYKLLIEEAMQNGCISIGDSELTIEQVECVVARVDESTNENQAILEINPFNLEMEEEDVRRILSIDGPLAYIISNELDVLNYQLNSKCDTCAFNINCFPESARQRRIELLGVSTTNNRALRNAGVNNIDDLADLDLNSETAQQIRRNPSFTENLQVLKIKAQTRRVNLPRGNNTQAYKVGALPYRGDGQLPHHEKNGQRLIRIYLSVDYDYSENRLGALSAHVTSSNYNIHTDFNQLEGLWKQDSNVEGGWIKDDKGKRRFVPNPEIKERIELRREAGKSVYDFRQVSGKDVIKFKSSEWSGHYNEDNGAEKELIQSFLHELVDAIAEVAEANEAPIHFYVWTRNEMTRLLEACNRVSSKLLGHLRELLGCRESLEQLIYSCLQDEINNRFALAWTGRGLSVVSSLTWFGRVYHWRRRISGNNIDLDRVFTQDIFDFKTTLDLNDDGTWAMKETTETSKHLFEIRSRFNDSLPAPYWKAHWRSLPDPASANLRPEISKTIERYNESRNPNYLREYLRARVHSLRWLEEGVQFKNAEISKQPLVIANLPDFSLGIENAAQAAIDFLRLDHHIKLTDWITEHLNPPVYRISYGRTIPVANVFSQGNNRITARINTEGFETDLKSLESRCSISEGSFVRLSPCSNDPQRGQTLKQLIKAGKTCRVIDVDWQNGQIILEALWMQETTYSLQSSGANEAGEIFDFATIDENISDFVAGHVENRIQTRRGDHVYRWFDPETPQIPEATVISESVKQRAKILLEYLTLPNSQHLASDQIEAIIDGINTRVHLLQGPPGTGKTTTTAISVLLRIAIQRTIGDVVILAAHTHTAINNLLLSMAEIIPAFQLSAITAGLDLPDISLSKVHSSQVESRLGNNINDFISKPCVTNVNRWRVSNVLVIGGTTGAILKMARELNERNSYRNNGGFQANTLIVDEASMMVLPHFLSLTSLIRDNGEIMLAGDHRQLSPIIAHDWENEDRPPTLIYQPFKSAYDAIQNIKINTNLNDRVILRSALKLTFRLPPIVRDLIARIYKQDNIELECLPRLTRDLERPIDEGPWQHVWKNSTGLFLVLHNERESRRSNNLEATIIEQIVKAAVDLPDRGVAVVTPHRAQRTLIQTKLENHRDVVDIIDTVERLQGGQRPTVLVSATVSDPNAIGQNVEFIMDINRTNVAFSRSQNRLIVICAKSLLDYVPVEIESYMNSMLWKSLRALCTELITTHNIDGYQVQVFTPNLSQLDI